MDSARPCHLGKALDAGLDLFARDHHQVGHLVDDDHDVRQRYGGEFLGLEHRLAGILVKAGLDGALEHLAIGHRLTHTAVVAVDVAHTHLRHLAIALFHFAHHPFQGDNRLLGVGDDRREQMRNAVIDRQFQHLRVDHDQPAFLGRQLVKQAQDHRVDRHRLARTGGPGNQQVGHLGKVRHDRIAPDILAKRQRQALRAITEFTGSKDLAQDNLFALRIGQFDPDDTAPRHGRNARRQRRHRARDIVGQTDHPAGLQARRGLQFIHRDHRTGANRDDLALHAIVVEHRFQHPRVFFQRLVRQRMTRDGRGRGQK